MSELLRLSTSCTRLAAAYEGALDHGFLTFLLLLIPHPDSRPTAVLVDELDARILKGASYDLKGRATRLAPLLFELVDGHDADARAISQILLAPAK